MEALSNLLTEPAAINRSTEGHYTSAPDSVADIFVLTNHKTFALPLDYIIILKRTNTTLVL